VRAIPVAIALLALAAWAGVVLAQSPRWSGEKAAEAQEGPLAEGVQAGWAADDAVGAAAADGARAGAPADGAIDRALPLISFDPRSLGHHIRVAPARPGVRAELDRRTRTITLFARASDPPHRWAHDLAHELGHAFDDLRMTAADRREYLSQRGRPGAQWAAAPGASDYATGAGDFAEVFALCHAASPDFRSRLASRPEDPCTVLPSAALRLPAPTPASMPPTTASP
jgi:hypothetical protein